jgi:hypothetical protein
MLPAQSGWPHKQAISILFAIPSQWALQYLALPGGMHEQAALPHFLGFAIVLPSRIHSDVLPYGGTTALDAK